FNALPPPHAHTLPLHDALPIFDAEYCLAEGGGVTRRGGKYVKGDTSSTEKEPRPIEVIAHGPAGHGSVPREANAVAHLTRAVDKDRKSTRLNSVTVASRMSSSA